MFDSSIFESWSTFVLFDSATAALFVPTIIFLAVILVWLEVKSYNHYQAKLKPCSDFIKYLNNNLDSPQLYTPDKTIKLWISKYLDIEDKQGVFEPKKVDNKFILLSYPSVLNSPVPRSPVYFAPTLLTALGILGTFWGIQSGLQAIGVDNVDNVDILIDRSTNLLSGMKLAFSTSLFGLGGATLLMILLGVIGNKKQNHRQKIRKDLNEIAILETPSHILSRIEGKEYNREESNNLTPPAIAQAVRAAIIQAFNSEKSPIITESRLQKTQAQSNREELESLVQPLANAIAVANAKQLQDLVTPLAGAIAEANQKQLKPLLTPLTDEVRSLRELQEQQGDTVETLVNQLRTELIEPLVKRLDESANLTKDVSENVQKLSESLDGITESLSNSIGTIQKFQETTMSELQEFSKSMRDTLTQFQTDTQGVLETVAVKINEVVDKSIEGLDKQRQVFRDNADEVANRFQSIHQIIEDTKELTQEELRIFRNEYQTQLEDFLTAQKGELEGIIQNMGGVLVEAGKSWKEIFDEITNKIGSSMSQINGTVKVTGDLVSAVGLGDTERMAQYQELMRDIGKDASQVSRSYQNAASQFEQALGQFAGYLQQANQSYCNNITTFDDSSTKIFNQMDRTSVELLNVANYLVAAAKDFKTGNGRNG